MYYIYILLYIIKDIHCNTGWMKVRCEWHIYILGWGLTNNEWSIWLPSIHDMDVLVTWRIMIYIYIYTYTYTQKHVMCHGKHMNPNMISWPVYLGVPSRRTIKTCPNVWYHNSFCVIPFRNLNCSRPGNRSKHLSHPGNYVFLPSIGHRHPQFSILR